MYTLSDKPHHCPPLLATLLEVTPSLACSEEGRAAAPLHRDHKGPTGTSYTWFTWDGLKEETVTYSKWPVIPTRPDPPREEVKTLQEEPNRRRRKRKNRRREGGRSRKEEAAVMGLDQWWKANFGMRKVVYIILNDTWKKATARGLDVPIPTSSSPSNPSSSSSIPSSSPSNPYSSPSNPSSSPWCSSSSPPHPSSTPTSGWTPPLPPAPYLSWRSLAADMRWGCRKTPFRVLKGGAPAPPSAPVPATPTNPSDSKVFPVT